MGTLVAIEARAADALAGERAVSEAFTAIHNVDRLFHPTRNGSELARLNRTAPGGVIPVHPWTSALLSLCRDLCARTAGGFEPALPGHGSVMDWVPVGKRGLRLKRRARLDLGGIAKGYAVDLAVAALRRGGVHAGLVNAGGDLRVFGSLPWPVALRAGYDSGAGTMPALALQDCALAVSACEAAAAPREHRGYYWPGAGGGYARRAARRTAAVIAPSAALADALTKVQLFAAPARAAAILAHYRARALSLAAPAPSRAPHTYSW